MTQSALRKVLKRQISIQGLHDGASVQEVLSEITNQRTMPNIFVNKVHVGGCDQTFQAHQSGLLQKLLQEDPAYDYDLIVIGGGSGGLSCAQATSGKGQETYYTAAKFVIATGERPRYLGIQGDKEYCITRTGKIPVNDVEQSSVPYVYAVGDVVEGKPELAPVVLQAGKLLARRLFGGRLEKCDYINAPTVVFTPLEYGCCGYAEEKAVEVYRKENLEGRVIGFHVLGPKAGEITQGFAAAMKCGLTKQLLDDTIGIHPTCAEVFTTLEITKSSGLDITQKGC
eukprot:bmy_20166T0